MVPRRTVEIVTVSKNVAHEVKTFKVGKFESIVMAGWGLSSRVAGRRVDADWRPSPRSTCRRGGERTQSPGSQALMLISHKVAEHIVVNSKFHVQMSWSMCEQSVDVTVPEVSKQFVTRFADVPLLAVAENVEACLSCWKTLRWRVWCCRNACSSGSASNLLM